MSIFFENKGFQEGYTPICGPENSPLEQISYGKLQLRQDSEPYTAETDDQEVVLDIFAGKADVTVKRGDETWTFDGLGGRESIFDGRPTLVCMPPNCTYTVKALTDKLDIGVSLGAAPSGGEPVVIGPDDSGTRIVGQGTFQRQVHLGTVETGKTKRLMVGETINQPGRWSSYPPHKHDEEKEGEIPMEEVYMYKVNPSQGFGIQVLYDDPNRANARDDAYLIHDGDTMALDHGYHPVACAPGYQVAYIWVLYAAADVYGSWSDDEQHVWVLEQ
jgi:5-deoxy-glucuronate isomerase